jgi:hypothetical protein
MAKNPQVSGKKDLTEVAVDRDDFNRNLQKLIHARPLKQSQVRPAKRKPAKIIGPHR